MESGALNDGTRVFFRRSPGALWEHGQTAHRRPTIALFSNPTMFDDDIAAAVVNPGLSAGVR